MFQSKTKKRLAALVAVLAIGVSGFASMAALTAQLTVTSTFQSATAELSGNGSADTADLFLNQVLSPGVKYAEELLISNSGNVALTVSGAAPVKSGPIANDIEVAVVERATNDATGVCDLTAFDNTGAGANGWSSVTGAYTNSWPPLSVGPLNAGDSHRYCFAARLPASYAGAGGDATVTQTFTGTE